MVASVRGVPLTRVLVGGAVAGLAQSVSVYLLASLLGARLGQLVPFLGNFARIGPARNAVIGGLVFGVMALAWAVLYSSIREELPGASGWQRGAIFGLAVWLASTAIILPLLAAAVPLSLDATPGLLALGFGTRAALTSLLAHLVYGGVLGGFLGR